MDVIGEVNLKRAEQPVLDIEAERGSVYWFKAQIKTILPSVRPGEMLNNGGDVFKVVADHFS